MMDIQLNTKRIVIFLAFAFGFSWAVMLAFYLTGGTDNRVVQPELAAPLMNLVFICGPVLANVATRLITKQGWGNMWLRPNFRRGWPFYLAVWLLPLLAAIVGSLAFYLLFPQSFDPDVTGARDLLALMGSPSAAQASPWMVMLFLTLRQMILQGVLIGGVVAIVEELGWRAYLLQRLVEHFHSANSAGRVGWTDDAGARKAALLVGVIHGVWHWPGFFMGLGIDNTYPGAPFLAPLVYIVFACSLSILLSWATLRSGSVWPASIGHGTVLGTMTLAISVLKGAANPVLGPAATGLIGGLGFVVLALVLYFNRRAFGGEKEVHSESVQATVGA